ncbi:hypothetical protein KUCAC02_026860, partial [Chaenocephalus aceratus]
MDTRREIQDDQREKEGLRREICSLKAKLAKALRENAKRNMATIKETQIFAEFERYLEKQKAQTKMITSEMSRMEEARKTMETSRDLLTAHMEEKISESRKMEAAIKSHLRMKDET